MIHLYIFSSLLIGSCAYALWQGGAPERIVGAALFTAAVASTLAPSETAVRFFEVELGVLLVDAVLLLVLVAVALRSDRFWPLFLAGLQLGAVGAHLVKWLEPSLLRVAYAILITAWSYPMLLLLVAGTWRHQRRLRTQGFDVPWTLPAGTNGVAI